MIEQFRKEYGWLSNFTDVTIVLDDIKYRSVEHAYMSAKSDEKEWKLFCADFNNTASKIKLESKTIKIKQNWNLIKLQVMEDCLRQKFNQEPFKTQLINTNDMYIQEGNNWSDKYWGVCLKTNQGSNHLGKLIMKIRTELRTVSLF